MQATPYVMFDGNCEAAFNYYAQHLGAKIIMMSRYQTMAGKGGAPADWQDKIIHARAAIGDTLLMGSDGAPYRKPQGMSVSLSVDTAEEAERIFAALSKGGSVGMPMQQTFFASRFGSVTDQFGAPWMVVCEIPM